MMATTTTTTFLFILPTSISGSFFFSFSLCFLQRMGVYWLYVKKIKVKYIQRQRISYARLCVFHGGAPSSLLSYKIHQLRNSNYAVAASWFMSPAHHNLTEFSLLTNFDEDSVSLSEESLPRSDCRTCRWPELVATNGNQG